MSISICFIQFTKCLVLKHRLLSAKPVSAHYQVHEVTQANFIETGNYATLIKKDFNFEIVHLKCLFSFEVSIGQRWPYLDNLEYLQFRTLSY